MPMPSLQRAVQVVRDYAAHPDPRVAIGNFVALLVVSNQPFYPLYLWWMVSGTVWPSLVTFLSTPFFLAVPAVSRRNAVAGRALLVVTGIANTLLCCKAFGVASGVEMFLMPCLVLALVLFRPGERLVSFGLAALAGAPYLLLHDRYGAPLHLYGAAEYTAFVRLNVMSGATLTALVAYKVAGLLAEAEAR